MNIHVFLHMGGYAFYVWTAYGLAAALLLSNLFITARRHRLLLHNLARVARRRSR